MSDLLRIDEETYRELMTRINEAKILHANAAKTFYNGERWVITDLIRRRFGAIQSFLYEPIPIPEKAYTSSLLSLLILEHLLLRLHRGIWRHLVISIVGAGGVGKTSEAINSMIGVLMNLGIGYNDAVKKVSNYIFFESIPAVSFIEKLIETKTWIPFILLDDIGSQISKYWIYLGENWWAELFSLLDQAKDWALVVLLTARRYSSIPARLRELSDIVIEMNTLMMDGMVFNLLTYYRYENYSEGRAKVSPEHVDFIDASLISFRMPDSLWASMLEERRKLGIKRLKKMREEMEQVLEEKKQKRRKKKGEESE